MVDVMEPPRGSENQSYRAGCDAGTVVPSLHIVSQSTNVEFLCWDDSLVVTHNQDFDISCDPDLSTQAGIGYIFYNCPPTINGPDVTTIGTDPCVNTTPPPPTGPFWIFTDDTDFSGNTTFWNGLNMGTSLQQFFNNGDPLELWFAPVTVDNFANRTYENGGPCVNANVNDAFRVVYLNSIQGLNPNVSSTGGVCSGSFIMDGGLPEFDGSNYSNIRVSLWGNPGVTGTITGGPYTHGDLVNFTVPQPGLYNVIIEDGVSCEALFTMDMQCAPAVELTFPTQTVVNVGDQFCIDVTVANWDSIITMQYSIIWDNSIIRLDNAVEVNLPIIDSNFGFPPVNGTIGYLGVADDIDFGYSLPDGSLLFSLCFTALAPGCSNLMFGDSPTPIGFAIADANTCIIPIDFMQNAGKVLVNGSAFSVIDTTIFNVSCTNSVDPNPTDNVNPNMDGAIALVITGGTAPYTFTWSNGTINSTGSQTDTVRNLTCAQYQVTITDSSMPPSPPIIQTHSISCPSSAASLAFGNTMQVSCNNLSADPITCDGVAQVTVNGGTSTSGNYTITWLANGLTDVNSTSTNTFLCSGWNGAQAVDDNGCIFIDSVNIGAPTPVVLSMDQEVGPTCSGDSNGLITVSASGGTSSTGSYAFAWEHGAMSAMITNLMSGDYIVTVTDDNMCTATDTIMLMEADPLIAGIDNTISTDSVTCNGGTNGFVSVLASGGNSGAFTYAWQPAVSTTNTAANLGAGLYTVTIQDTRGCVDIVNHQIFEPTVLNAVIPDPVDPACFGDETFIKVTNANGGNGGPYFFAVDNGIRLPITDSIPVIAGPHLVTVFDNESCIFEVPKNINDGSQVQVDVGPDITIELGDNGVIRGFVNSTGGNTIVGSQWDTSIPTNFVCRDTQLCLEIIVDPIESVFFTLTVTDDQGCVGQDEVFVEVNNRRNVFVPNAFSPNGDGRNDVFRVFTGLGVDQINYMRIFDRWGNLMYEVVDVPPSNSDADSRGWDGKYRGDKMNSGVYVYLIEVQFIDGRTLLYRGDVTLAR